MNDTSDMAVFEPDRLYTADEVAEKLKLSRSSVLSRARRGTLPSLKLGAEGMQRTSVRFVGGDMSGWPERRYRCARTKQRAASPQKEDRLSDFLRWRETREAVRGLSHEKE